MAGGAQQSDRSGGDGGRINQVFVYGTFRAGQTARALIAGHVTHSTGATVAGAIYDLPEGYPALLPGSPGTVVGELLELDDLPAAFALFDAYEGEDFVRTLCDVTLDDASTTRAWCYVLRDPSAGERAGTRVANGDWLAWQKLRGAHS